MRLLGLVLMVVIIGSLGCDRASYTIAQEKDEIPVWPGQKDDLVNASKVANLVVPDHLAALRPETVKDSTQMGQPFRAAYIGLNKLKEVKPGEEAAVALVRMSKPDHLLVPVLLERNIKWSQALDRKDGKWVPATFGESPVLALADHERLHLREIGIDPNSSYLIFVRAMNVVFLAYPTEKDVMLIPLADFPLLGFKKNESVSATFAVKRMHEFAERIDAKKPG